MIVSQMGTNRWLSLQQLKQEVRTYSLYSKVKVDGCERASKVWSIVREKKKNSEKSPVFVSRSLHYAFSNAKKHIFYFFLLSDAWSSPVNSFTVAFHSYTVPYTHLNRAKGMSCPREPCWRRNVKCMLAEWKIRIAWERERNERMKERNRLFQHHTQKRISSLTVLCVQIFEARV